LGVWWYVSGHMMTKDTAECKTVAFVSKKKNYIYIRFVIKRFVLVLLSFQLFLVNILRDKFCCPTPTVILELF